jgi:hypothetical protein
MHGLGVALGSLAVALAAFASYSLPDDYGRYIAALAGACVAASTYILHAYPTEVSASPPPQPLSP